MHLQHDGVLVVGQDVAGHGTDDAHDGRRSRGSNSPRQVQSRAAAVAGHDETVDAQFGQRRAQRGATDPELTGELMLAGQGIAEHALRDRLTQDGRSLIRHAGATEAGEKIGMFRGNTPATYL